MFSEVFIVKPPKNDPLLIKNEAEVYESSSIIILKRQKSTFTFVGLGREL